MSGQCRACRHWQPPDVGSGSGRADAAGFGTCYGVEHGFDASRLAFTTDAEDYDSGIRSRPEFGCALFELIGRFIVAAGDDGELRLIPDPFEVQK